MKQNSEITIEILGWNNLIFYINNLGIKFPHKNVYKVKDLQKLS